MLTSEREGLASSRLGTEAVGVRRGEGASWARGTQRSGAVPVYLIWLELDTRHQPNRSWFCRVHMYPVHAPWWLASDSRGVIVANVMVLAIGQIQDIQPKGDVVGYLPGHSKVGRQTRGSANAVVLNQRG